MVCPAFLGSARSRLLVGRCVLRTGLGQSQLSGDGVGEHGAAPRVWGMPANVRWLLSRLLQAQVG